MARVTPDQFVEKHARRLKGALVDMEAGVNAVTESPTLKAAAKKDKMRANLVNAIDNGKWEAGLKRVTTEEWKEKMINKGIPRVSAGIDGAAAKVKSFAEQLLPHIDASVAQIKKMPDVTLDDNINRMTAHIRNMAKFKRK